MSNDLMARAGRALQPAAARDRQAAGSLDPAKGAQLLARAEAAIAAPPTQILIAAPPPSRLKPMRLSVSRRPKSGKWICKICGVPGCMIAPVWVTDER